MRDNHNVTDQQLQEAIRIPTDRFKLICRSLETNYDIWLQNLIRYREENPTLKLFSNRQIMIMIILLSTGNPIKRHFLEKLYSSIRLDNHHEKELKLTLQLLSHYLHALRINDSDLSEDNISRLYEAYKIQPGTNPEMCLQQLCQFLQALFTNEKKLSPQNSMINENQQYLVNLNTLDEVPHRHNLDIDTYRILLNLFQNRLPSFHEILWCSSATEDDIHLFFSRVRTFQDSTFVIMNIDQMHHRLHEVLLNEQDVLSRLQEPHGIVYYVARGSVMSRKNLRLFELEPKHRDLHKTYKHLSTLFQQNSNGIRPEFEIICGSAGIGE
jgi:hypothetical protein